MLTKRFSLAAFALAASLSLPGAAPAGSKDIVSTAMESGQFDTLAAALTAAELVETLQGDGPFTVFAPTDEAFAQLPEGTLDTLLKPENKDQLTRILTYHVVPGKVMASDISDGMTAASVLGDDLTFNTSDGVKVNNANVVQADIETSNGVIHVVDAVILP